MPKLLHSRPALDDKEERQLRKLAGSRHAPGDWIRRATMIARSWDGLRTVAIAQELGCHPQTVREWLLRFNAEGLDGLGDRPGPGRKPRLSESERDVIVGLVATDLPGRLVRQPHGELEADDERGPARWTLDALAGAAPGWSRDGHRLKAHLDYGRGPEKVWVYGALRVRNGRAVTLTAASRNTAGYLRLLEEIARANPAGDLYVIGDNLSTHKSPPIMAWLQDHSRVHQVFIPVGGLLAEPPGGLVAAVPPRGRRRPALRRRRRDQPRHPRCHRPAHPVRQTVGWNRPTTPPRPRRRVFVYRL
jgi:transposase